MCIVHAIVSLASIVNILHKSKEKKYSAPFRREVVDYFIASCLPEHICRNWHLRHRRFFIFCGRLAEASQGWSLRLSGYVFSYSIEMRESSRGREECQYSRAGSKETLGTTQIRDKIRNPAPLWGLSE